MAEPRSRHDFSIALICALVLEAECVLAILDVQWPTDKFPPVPGDTNAYTIGTVGGHHAVLVHLPDMGVISAAGVTSQLLMSFPNIKVALVVGICGGVPNNPTGDGAVVLGDVMISSRLVQYDSGREYPRGFQIRARVEDTLSHASLAVKAWMNKVRTTQYVEALKMATKANLRDVHAKVPKSKDPGFANDHLYDSSYVHQHRGTDSQSVCYVCSNTDQICQRAIDASCDEIGCEKSHLIERPQMMTITYGTLKKPSRPSIYFTTIASGNRVMKSAKERDRLAEEMAVGAFEMEGAGVWQYIPTMVVKGVADYADCHKSKQFQRFAAATAAACTKALLKEMPNLRAHISSDRNISVPVAWTVPFSRLNPFIGRQKEVQTLTAQLFEQGGRRRAAIVGPAGIGKSRLALEIASMARDQILSLSILWVQASDRSTVERDFLRIGRALKISGTEEEKVDVISQVRQHLNQTSSSWLFILDNADDESLWGLRGVLTDILPDSSQGSVLITTRTRRVGFQLASNNLIHLSPLNEDEALALMKQQLAGNEDDGNDDDDDNDEAGVMKELFSKLGYFPLAIVQAASYMIVNENNAAEYLRLLDESDADVLELLDEDFPVDGRYAGAINSILSTWKVSFGQIQSHNRLATDYLSFLSCLNENQIPKSVLMPGPSPKKTNDALGILKAYSLISDQHEHLFMHNLVRLAVRNWMEDEDTLSIQTDAAIRRFLTLVPAEHNADKHIWLAYLPHAQKLCESTSCTDFRAKYFLLQRVGRCLMWCGNYADAIPKLELVVNWQNAEYGELHECVLSTYHDLGQALLLNGDWERANFYLELVYAQNLHRGGKELLNIMYNLVTLYTDQGRLQKAERLVQQALQIGKEMYGTHHVDLLTFNGKLALIYLRQNRSADAANMLEPSVRTLRSTLGIDNSKTRENLNNLATVYCIQRRYAEAETIQLQTLGASRRVAGFDHPATLACAHNLALNYFYQKRFREAEDLLTQVFKSSRTRLGLEHPNTLKSMLALAKCKLCLGQQQGSMSMTKTVVILAFKLMRQCVDVTAKKFGADHHLTRRHAAELEWWTQQQQQQQQQQQ